MDLLQNFWFKTVSSLCKVRWTTYMSCELNDFIMVLTRWFLHSSYTGWTEDDRKLSQRVQAPAFFWPCECHYIHFHRLNTRLTGKMAIFYIWFVHTEIRQRTPLFITKGALHPGEWQIWAVSVLKHFWNSNRLSLYFVWKLQGVRFFC